MPDYRDIWEMRQGGPHEKTREMFKCTHCGGETHPHEGWNGEPSVHNCSPDCPCRSDWSPGRVSNSYRDNFERTFPGAPGTGI